MKKLHVILTLKMAGYDILRCCKLVSLQSSSSSSEMSDPNGPLSRKIPSRAIELANAKVTELTDKPRGHPPFYILTPTQRFKVGKRAAEHGVTVSRRYFAKKYPKLLLKENL